LEWPLFSTGKKKREKSTTKPPEAEDPFTIEEATYLTWKCKFRNVTLISGDLVT